MYTLEYKKLFRIEQDFFQDPSNFFVCRDLHCWYLITDHSTKRIYNDIFYVSDVYLRLMYLTEIKRHSQSPLDSLMLTTEYLGQRNIF